MVFRIMPWLRLEGGVLTTDLLRAYGPALGLTAKGKLDFRQSDAQIKGTIVPAYTANRILGHIPILNWILVGGEGEGFVAVTYAVSGPLDKPEVSVNPLAALAPGFLRRLFSLLDEAGNQAGEPYPEDFGAFPPDVEGR